MSLKAMTCAMALRGVTASEKLLLLALANYADENMTCFPSQKRLADDACLSQRTVLNLLADLEARRMISRARRHRPDGSRSSDSITLHFAGSLGEVVAGGGEVAAGGVVQPLQGGGAVVAPLTSFEPVIDPVILTGEGASAPPARKATKRCPSDWMPTEADRGIGITEGLTPGEIDRALAKMRDHSFKTARVDWSAAFRNWLRSDAESKSRHAKPDKLAARHDNYAASWAGAEQAAGILAARRAF